MERASLVVVGGYEIRNCGFGIHPRYGQSLGQPKYTIFLDEDLTEPDLAEDRLELNGA